MPEVRVSGALRTNTAAKAMLGGQARNIVSASIYDGTTLKQVAKYRAVLSASANPASAVGSAESGNTARTNPVTITPAGGKAPYTYSWARISGRGAVDSPASATTRFSEPVSGEETAQGIFRCTVTEADGATAAVDIEATFFSFINDFGDGN